VSTRFTPTSRPEYRKYFRSGRSPNFTWTAARCSGVTAKMRA
jgi:hypothetical protein